MVVNIVMLVKGRFKLTRQTLDTLNGHTSKDNYNLTIVDDEQNEFLPEEWEAWLRTFGNHVTCLRIKNSKSITGQARNLGVYWAEKYWGRGDWLYLSDNDMYFTPGWLESLTNFAAKTEPTFELWGGWNHPFLQPHSGYNKVPKAMWATSVLRPHDAVTGASQLMRWETWDNHGPLDAHAPGVGQSEDWKFCQDIVKDGGKVGSIYPRVVFNCGVTNSYGQPSTGADVMVKELEEAKKQYPDLIWE